jgi:D-sedoheptulose 7-phosphate isomerase
VNHVAQYLAETKAIAGDIDQTMIIDMVNRLSELRTSGGRLWIAGLGGSAANASHAANDFRKLCGIEAHCMTDNVSEITARANDGGWNTALSLDWVRAGDALMVLSVGGGADGVSLPLIRALNEAKRLGMSILGIVGRDGGRTRMVGDCVIVVPTVNAARVTPHTEGWQSVILHCLVSHPLLQRNQTKW